MGGTSKQFFVENFCKKMQHKKMIMEPAVIKAVSEALERGDSAAATKVISVIEQLDNHGDELMAWRVVPALQHIFLEMTGAASINPQKLDWLTMEECRLFAEMATQKIATNYVDDAVALALTGVSPSSIFKHIAVLEEEDCRAWIAAGLPPAPFYQKGKMLAHKLRT